MPNLYSAPELHPTPSSSVCDCPVTDPLFDGLAEAVPQPINLEPEVLDSEPVPRLHTPHEMAKLLALEDHGFKLGGSV